ncbi:LysR family transcriptional regulator [Pseudomonas reactans]|uniref:LysR family transcriptional regulator n=1 Tax=Pseudomonas reactans TaxID=117680 RepID=UPI0015A1E5C9|nr:LysR family transcriptional regulator [Pseudomonas reactans]NWC88356.1 LysR family transcriptional regulator [Pseudomonas reactans]NWD30235.1 LysR family transcriptional regulator [Pseudomonas reactans]
MDRFRAMQVFVTATEAGSFARAANVLEMSAQMVARYIGHLEEHLNVRLLNRTTRRQQLTEFGRAYYDRCVSLLADLEAADALALETHAHPVGALKISAPQNFGAQSLMPVINQFLAAHPRVEIDLDLTDRYVDLIAEGVEVAFRIGAPAVDDSTSLVVRPLRPYQMLVCAAPAYLDAHGAPTHPSDLASHSCLGYVFSDRVTDKQWVFTRNGKSYPVSVGSRLRVNSADAHVKAAIAGFGLVMATLDQLAPALASGQLVRVLPNYEGPSKPMSLIYPADRQRTAKLRHFIDRVMDVFGA